MAKKIALTPAAVDALRGGLLADLLTPGLMIGYKHSAYDRFADGRVPVEHLLHIALGNPGDCGRRDGLNVMIGAPAPAAAHPAGRLGCGTRRSAAGPRMSSYADRRIRPAACSSSRADQFPHQHLASSDAVDPERKPINRCAINWFQFVKLIGRRGYPA